MEHLPVQISFRHMDRSAALEQNIRERADALLKFSERIMRCDVVVEQEHQRHQQGNNFHVRIHITVPDHEVVVSREAHANHAHEDPYVAVRDAFDAARRQLEDLLRKTDQRAQVSAAPQHGRISEVIPMLDYGRIETSDGRSIYFHRNSVINANFDKLDVGMEVRFSEEAGEEGPQASSVQLIGKHHIAG